MMKTLRSAMFTALVAFSLGHLTYAQSDCKVEKIEGATVYFNKASLPSTGGSHFLIVRGGKNLAEIELDKTSGQGRIVRLFAPDAILPGDQIVADDSAAKVPVGGPPVGGPPVSGTPTATVPTPTRIAGAATRALPADLTLEAAENNYRQLFEARTQKHKFRQVLQQARLDNDENKIMGVNKQDAFMWAETLAIGLGPGGFYGDPTFLLSNAYYAWMSNRDRNKLFAGVEVLLEAEVTVWDPALLESYGQYAAIVNGFTDTKQYSEFVRNLQAQRGVTSGKVFEVKLKNVGQVKAQLSPFNWHAFMQGPNGSKVPASRYDPALDRQIDPGREVSGNVYFPNAPADHLVLSLEDMYGDRHDMEFQFEP